MTVATSFNPLVATGLALAIWAGLKVWHIVKGRRVSTCADCKHSSLAALADGSTELLCKRYPPTPLWDGDEDGYAHMWPSVDESDWCGEWRGIHTLDSTDER